MFERSRFVLACSLLSAASALLAAGCASRHADPAGQDPPAVAEAPADMTPESTIVEESDQGTITWSVTTDGHVEAVVKAADGRVITRDIEGFVTWPHDAGDDFAYVKLSPEGHLLASGPALEADLTEIDYDLVVEGKPWAGVLHVPRGGTHAIEADARVEASAAAPAVPAGKKGPNGGVIQRIGGELVEMVADKTTGEVRVYVLGPDLEPIEPGERRIRLGYVADDVETIDLVREPGFPYFVGRVRTRIDPVRVTLAVGVGVSVHVGIVGFQFGGHLGCGVRAAAIPLMVERRWTPSVVLGVDVRVRERVDVRERVEVRERVGGRERVEVRGRVEERGRGHERGEGREHERGEGHDHGVRDHGRGEGREHAEGRGREHEHGRPAPARGGGGRGKKH
jgi:hypothetical protein